MVLTETPLGDVFNFFFLGFLSKTKDAKGASCMTYGAWPVKKADPFAGPDASCYSMSVGRRLATEEVDLDFFSELLSGSEGSSHMNIVSAAPNCFTGFSWYSLSQPIDVPSHSIEVIKYMVRYPDVFNMRFYIQRKFGRYFRVTKS